MEMTMANLQKSKKKEELEKKEQLLEQNLEKVKVGDIYVKRDVLIKVTQIKKHRKTDEEPTVWFGASDNLGKSWRDSYGSDDLSRFIKEYGDSKIEDVDKWYKEVLAVINGEISINDYKDNQDISKETGLMKIASKEHLVALQQSMEEKRKRAEIIAKGVYLEMERRKDELDIIRRELGVIVDEFREKVEQIEKVIWTIELYLGIKEDIVQIQSGQSAGEQETIHFWQETLFMDEEVGDPMDGQGLDFKNIEDFDKWLLNYSEFYKKKNYEVLIPQKKGLIVFRVRREDKTYYVDNPWLNAMMNVENKQTYILIRNGTNIYRIWGDIKIFPKLFPDRSELEELRQKWEYITDIEEKKNTKYIGDSKYGYISDTEEEKKKIDKQLFRYKQYMIMLQGLIDRTEIFYPIPGRVNVMSPESHDKGQVKFVYEDDLRLTDGKLSFREWQKELNKDISEGSRILYVSKAGSGGEREYHLRFDQRYHKGSYWGGKTHYNTPDGPQSGIYQLKKYVTVEELVIEATANSKEELPKYEIKRWVPGKFDNPEAFPHTYEVKDENGHRKWEKKKTEYLALYYNPGDTVRNTWDYYDYGHERKNSISYKIYPEDKNILAYDFIDLKDVEYYLYERRHRRDYIKMMPVLWEIKKKREEELKKETEFVKGLIEDMKRKNQKLENPRQVIWDAIEWYKTKNKWKRPLTENDQLAWKLVRRKLGLKE